MASAALELALRIRPEELSQTLEFARARLSSDYLDAGFASDLPNAEERVFLAAQVERLMRNVQYDLGFKGGVNADHDG